MKRLVQLVLLSLFASIAFSAMVLAEYDGGNEGSTTAIGLVTLGEKFSLRAGESVMVVDADGVSFHDLTLTHEGYLKSAIVRCAADSACPQGVTYVQLKITASDRDAPQRNLEMDQEEQSSTSEEGAVLFMHKGKDIQLAVGDSVEVFDVLISFIARDGEVAKLVVKQSAPLDCEEVICPMYAPPAPDWCDDGVVVPSSVDECGCQGHPTCLRTSSKPVCDNIGTRSEGWYHDGELVAYDNCACVAVCEKDGWYNSCDGKLIVKGSCSDSTAPSPIVLPVTPTPIEEKEKAYEEIKSVTAAAAQDSLSMSEKGITLETSAGLMAIAVTPSMAQKEVENRLRNAEVSDVKLVTDNGNPTYIISGTQQKRVLFFFSKSESFEEAVSALGESQ